MEMRDQYGNRVGQMDSYGNPVQQHQQQATDAYGNPVVHRAAAAHGQGTYGGHEGVGGHGMFTGGHSAGGQAQMMHPGDQHHGAGILHRSGSSSSSSSEDDGMGGRRKKKGLKEKIKEKLPGGQKTDEYGQPMHGQAATAYGGTTTAGTAGATGVHYEPEKKGMMEKIKEKLPGGHKTDEYGQPMHGQPTTGYGGTTATATTGATWVHHEPEKKGMMEKIKEKLPGHH